MESAISVKGLTREYVTRSFFGGVARTTMALSGIDLEVRKGELFGLIGPNGAGKTTTIKILTTLLSPSGGEARILGLDVSKDLYEIRRRIGIVFGGERGLYNRVTAMDNLRYFSDLYGVDPSVAKKRIPQLLEVVGLSDRAQERVEKYSRGMKQRLHIAKALVHDPEVLFLDEPTASLDPDGADRVREVLRTIRAERGMTIFYTSHNMQEVERLSDRILFLHHGRIIADGPPGEVLRRFDRDTLEQMFLDLAREGAPA